MLPLARELAPAHSVHVLDLPGHGQSEMPRTRLSISSLSVSVEDWLDAVGLERTAFVANSMGCQVVTDLAVREPHRVGAMVLIGPTVDPRRRSARHQLLSVLRDMGREPVSLVALTAEDEVGVGLPALLAMGRSALSDPIEDRLPLIDQPTTIVRGSNDGFTGDEWVRDIVRMLPNGRLVVVPGEAHAVHYTRPRLVARIVREAVADEQAEVLDERCRRAG
jgi:2-hydroxy-6-oxonona-2,4-dienedioate hydrolase